MSATPYLQQFGRLHTRQDDRIGVDSTRPIQGVTDGVIDYLSDCTHALAGQKVPMVEWRGYSAEDYL